MWVRIQLFAYGSLFFGYALLLFLAVPRRIGRGRAQRLLEVSLLLAVVWTGALGLMARLAPGGWWAFVWHRTAQIGLVVLALLTAEFAEAFVERSSRRWPRLALVLLLVLAALVLDLWPAVWPGDLSPVPDLHLGPTEVATLLLASAWAVCMVAAWWTSGWAVRRAIGSKHRNRIRYLQVALLGFTAGDVLILIGGIPDVYVGLAARALGFAVLTYALLRYDLPDLERHGRMMLRVVLMVGLTAGLYLVVVLVMSLVAAGLANVALPAVLGPTIVLALLLAAVADVALGPRLQRYFDRTVLRRGYDVQKALRAYSQQISLILDLERLADTTLEWLRTTLRVERAAFILFTSRGDKQIELSVLRATSSRLPPPQLFAVESRFVLHCRNIGRPLSQYDLDMLSWFQVMETGERKWLKELAVDLYVPVLAADEPVAVLALGPKADGQPYSQEDLVTLTTLAGQTGTAVENARLMDDLRAVRADLHRLSDELGETNRQLKRLDQAKSDFVTIASHELRTPLAQIYGYSDVLASMEGEQLGASHDVQKFIAGIARGARRLSQVVDAMIDMSLIETGALKLQLSAVSLRDVLLEVVQAVEPAREERSVVITVRDLSALPAIRADRARLVQALTGVVGNAIKFSPDGQEVVVSGHAIPSLPDPTHVELLVADRGIGVAPEEKALIFEKFYRPEDPLLHSTGEAKFKGAGPGLGLAIAKGIVEAHGGRIWVESPGRSEETYPGSMFHVRLPLSGPTLAAPAERSGQRK